MNDIVLPPGTLAAFGLYLVRTSALVLASPFFGAATNFSGVKIGLIATISMALYASHGTPLEGAAAPLAFGALALREVLIGLALAFVMQAAVLAVRVAGEMVGQEMAFTMASVVDPASGVNTPLITQLYEGLFLLGLLAADGHHLLLRALSDSFERAPIGRVGIESGLAHGVLQLFSDMFAAGITFAAPVLSLLFLTSLLIGLLARAVPSLNILEVGFSLRILTGLVALLVFAPLIGPALDHLYGAMASGLDDVLGIIGS